MSVVHTDLPTGHCKCLEELFAFIFSSGSLKWVTLAGSVTQKLFTIPLFFTCSSFLCLNLQGEVIEGNDVSGALCIAQPWPGMARTIHGDHQRFIDAYFKAYPGKESAKGRQLHCSISTLNIFSSSFCYFCAMVAWRVCHRLQACPDGFSSVDLYSCQKGCVF